MSSVLLDNILIDLRVIAKVPENGKISTTTSDPIAIDDKNTYQGIRRWIYGDSREQMYKVIKNLVDKIVDISDTMLGSPYMNFNDSKDITHHEYMEHRKQYDQLNKLATEVEHALKGFANIHGTYQDDATIASKLEVLMDKLEEQKNKIKTCLEKITNNN